MAEVLDWVVSGKAVRATKYISKKDMIRATRKTFKGKIVKGNVEVIFSIGKPNFREREYIKNVLSKEKFPIEGVVVKLYEPKTIKVGLKSKK